MNSWSLDDIYSSYESIEFQSDLKKLDDNIIRFKEFKLEDKLNKIEEAILLLEENTLLSQRLFSFVGLNESTDTTDKVSANYSAILNTKFSNFSSEYSRFFKFFGNITTDISKSDILSEYTFLFKEAKEKAKHLLSDEVESVIAKMNLSAGSSWGNLQNYLTSIVEGSLNGETITLPQVRNLAYDENQEVRKNAYLEELNMYKHIKEPIAFALNNIKSQVNDIAELRGYDSPLTQTLAESKMSKETLDSLLSAMRDFFPVFRKYLKHKANLLGHKNGLPFYDLFAPIGNSSRTFTVDEMKNFLIETFKPFSEDLAEMTKEMFEKNHIDIFPKKGKVGGAFCYDLPFIKQSRILLNYSSTLSDVVTAAHELGHAYHNLNIKEHRALNNDYSMPVAETASTFNENILLNSILKTAEKDEKINIIEQQLQDATQIIIDIYSRFMFESEVFEKRKNSFLFADDLEKIMIKAQKETYGDGLDENFMHPYMWVNKGHYYSESTSFYNFPYAFGGLFAKGLYSMYKENPDEFADKYKNMLYFTTIGTVEETAQQMGIDLTKKDFWIKALKLIEEDINEFIELTK